MTALPLELLARVLEHLPPLARRAAVHGAALALARRGQPLLPTDRLCLMAADAEALCRLPFDPAQVEAEVLRRLAAGEIIAAPSARNYGVPEMRALLAAGNCISWEAVLAFAVFHGNTALMGRAQAHGADNQEQAQAFAASCDNLRLFTQFNALPHEKDYTWFFSCACSEGAWEVASYLIRTAGLYLSMNKAEGLCYAIAAGYYRLACKIILHDCRCVGMALEYAAKNMPLSVVEAIFSLASDFDCCDDFARRAAEHAAIAARYETVVWLCDQMPYKEYCPDSIIHEIAKRAPLPICKVITSKFELYDVDVCFSSAAAAGNYRVAKWAMRRGGKIEYAFRSAAAAGNWTAVHWLQKLGARDYARAIAAAVSSGNHYDSALVQILAGWAST